MRHHIENVNFHLHKMNFKFGVFLLLNTLINPSFLYVIFSILYFILFSYLIFIFILFKIFHMRSLGADLCSFPVKPLIHLAIKSCEYLISNFLGWPVSISCEYLGRPCAPYLSAPPAELSNEAPPSP